MTTPTERTQAVLRRLVMTMRHYPTRYDLERSAQALPDVWGEPDGKKPGEPGFVPPT